MADYWCIPATRAIDVPRTCTNFAASEAICHLIAISPGENFFHWGIRRVRIMVVDVVLPFVSLLGIIGVGTLSGVGAAVLLASLW